MRRRRKMSALQRLYFSPRRRKVRTMARRYHKRRVYTAAYSSPRRFHRRASRGFARGFGSAMPYLGAGIYGAFRGRLSNALMPVTSKIPLGGISDEVGMFALLWAGKKFIGNKVPMVGDIARAGMLIEAARIGEAVALGQVSMNTASNSNLMVTVG